MTTKEEIGQALKLIRRFLRVCTPAEREWVRHVLFDTLVVEREQPCGSHFIKPGPSEIKEQK